MIAQISKDYEHMWQRFAQQEGINELQLNQFQQYYSLLVKTNTIHNLTTITDLTEVLDYHFSDSLALGHHFDCVSIATIADIGTGAGFPAIPLKIRYPHLRVVLIEVTKKKIDFLTELVDRLQLENVTIVNLDWRTFLRKTEFAIDLFCARASLDPKELLRLFTSTSPYNKARLVYWASAQWVPLKMEPEITQRVVPYQVGNKNRKLIFFQKVV